MKKTARSAAWLLILVLSVVMMFPFGGVAEAGRKHTTVMVYMCGSDLESCNSQATQSMGDMIASKFNLDAVNVVILAGGSRYWSGRYDTDKLTMLSISGRRPSVVDEFPVASMGDAETLSFFLKTCRENYPAEHYDLVLWNHGGGPNGGVCFDSLHHDDSLSIEELQSALKNSPFAQDPLDLLIFHACLMSSAEVADAVSPYARYMVAGEDSIYELSYQWLSGVENDPDSWETAKRIVDYSYEYNGKLIQMSHESLQNSFAAIDLSRMEEIIGLMDAFFPRVSVNLDEASFTTMSGERRGTVCFGVGESGSDADYDLVDLGDLVNHFRYMAETEADALISTLNSAVYCHTDTGSGCTGMTVYHPFNNRKTIPSRMSAYSALDFSEAYKNYIQQFASLLLDVPMTTWKDLGTSKEPANKSTFSAFMVSLNESQADCLADASLCVLLKGEDDTYRLIYTDPTLSYGDGLVRGEYNGTALYVVDPSGAALSQPLEYAVDANGNYLISAELQGVREDGEPYTQKALICCVLEEDTGRLTPMGVQIWEDFLESYTPAYAGSFSDYQAIRIPADARVPKLNERGEMPAFSEWEAAEAEDLWQGAIDDSWTFALCDVSTALREDIYVTFQLTDSQNNAYSSSMIALTNPDPELFIEYNNDEIEALILEDESYIAKLIDDNLRVSGPVAYSGEREIVVNAVNLAANGVQVGEEIAAVVYGRGPNWGLVKTSDDAEPDTQALSVQIGVEHLDPSLEYQTITMELQVVDAQTNETLATVPVTVRVKSARLFPEDA